MVSKVSGWDTVRVGDAVEMLSGFAFKSTYFDNEEGIPLIRIRDLYTHKPVTNYKGEYDSRYIVREGDILVGMDGEFDACKWQGPESLLNQRVLKVNAKDNGSIVDDFLYYRIQSELKRIENETSATTVKHLSTKDVANLELLVPPILEQRKIAAILTSVDDEINATQRIIDQTEVVKRGLMLELLTKGIGHTTFKETETGEIPTDWDLVELAEVTTKVTDGTHQSPEFVSEGVPFLLVSNIASGYIDWATDKYVSNGTYNTLTKHVRPEVGDILYSAVGSYGVAVVVETDQPFAFQRHIAHIKPRGGTIDSDFLAFILNSPIGKKQADKVAVGNAQKTVTLGSLSKFVIPLPKLDEQKRIAASLLSTDKAIVENKRYLDGLQTVKNGLMQVLLSGKVRVNVDEPSEVSV